MEWECRLRRSPFFFLFFFYYLTFMKSRLSLSFFALLAGIMQLHAIPATRITQTYTQTDSTSLSLTLQGDEYLNYFLTSDNIPVIESSSHDYCYPIIKDGNLIASDIIAHEPYNRNEAELNFISNYANLLTDINSLRSARISEQNARRSKKRTNITRSSLGQYGNYVGDYKGLVLLVEFQNLKFSTDYPNQDFNRMFNSRGYAENGAIGSVSDYFRDQSYNKFNLSFDVVGPLMMSENYEYYGYNNPLTGNDRRVADMVAEAVRMADQYVDYNIYDWDKDGEVDQVYIIYAGYGESYGAASNTIWPHESSIDYYNIVLDGVRIATYGCSCELAGISGSTLNGIGTSCHEFSHCLGFPDLYDTDYSGAFGMGHWDIMDSGSYNGPKHNGEVPYGYSAYERWCAGWLTPREIESENLNISLRNLGDFPDAAIIYNDGNRNEFYILENHQNLKWFSYVRDQKNIHGMMATHINFDEKAWAANRVNSKPDDQRMTIIPADNEYSSTPDSYAADLFPGAKNITFIGNDTHKETSGFLYNPNSDGSYKMNKSIVDITENEYGIISFGVVFNHNIPIPQTLEASDIDQTGFTARWHDAGNADSFILEYLSYDTSFSFVPIPRVKRVEDIHDTSLRLEWLVSPEATSQFRVKSIYHGVESDWSEFQEVKYSSDSEDSVFEAPADEAPTEIYGPDGIRRDSLHPGINIVRNRNGVKKVYVPL